MRLAIRVLVCISLLVLAAVSPNLPVQAQAPKAGGVDWTAGTVSAVGSGVYPQGKPAAQARLMARRAATADAYRQLAEAIQGVQVTSETVVKNFETESDEIRTQVSALVKGARVVEENVTPDGAYEVRMELPLFGANSLATAVFNGSLIKKRTLAPDEMVPVAPQVEAPGGTRVSGLVVDARGLGAKAAMMPAFFDEQGAEVYMGALKVSNDDLVARGPVTYVKDFEAGKKHERVGAAPLVVKAKRFKGPFHADLVLPADDARRLVQSNEQDGFLKNMAVVVVL